MAKLPYTFNNSMYFVRSGQKIRDVAYKIDDYYMQPRTLTQMYMDNINHWKAYKKDAKPHKGMKNIYDFQQCYFNSMLSFLIPDNYVKDGEYVMNGLNTNGQSVNINVITTADDALNANYAAQAGTNNDGFTAIDFQPAGAAWPVSIICTTARILIHGKRNITPLF
mmetsp:Transcript_55968/g.147994  ORF Transcript_55968/g.147994 Transcript_55968/m.147994 type:complete len:166 (-) Transcript_55968:906-1403(-)